MCQGRRGRSSLFATHPQNRARHTSWRAEVGTGRRLLPLPCSAREAVRRHLGHWAPAQALGRAEIVRLEVTSALATVMTGAMTVPAERSGLHGVPDLPRPGSGCRRPHRPLTTASARSRPPVGRGGRYRRPPPPPTSSDIRWSHSPVPCTGRARGTGMCWCLPQPQDASSNAQGHAEGPSAERISAPTAHLRPDRTLSGHGSASTSWEIGGSDT